MIRGESFELWDRGTPMPSLEGVPYLDRVTHVYVHRACEEYHFLHGAAIAHHEGVLFTSWENSPIYENSSGATLRGRRSHDNGLTWGDVEVIAPELEGDERHSHGAFLSHQGKLWAFASRYGGLREVRFNPDVAFPDIRTEAFVLDEQTDRWESQGTVAGDIYPYDEPMRMDDGNWIMAGMNSLTYPVVAISHGDDFTSWDTVAIPAPDRFYFNALSGFAAICVAETTVIPEGDEVLAYIRPQKPNWDPVVLVSVSKDFGRTWSEIRESNFSAHMTKVYAGKLSTGQRYLIANQGNNRHSLVIAVSRPDQKTFSKIWKIRHGLSAQPRFPGQSGKGPQWCYPYAIEHDDSLYAVYSVTKEDCELSIIPLEALS
ncbi:MAG: sialidase family protein [Candidatus Latescibacteria bacterium]|jgi:hypothetical protein|nr:sialidase family protein [Candidatus Latescibacterota bacterium]